MKMTFISITKERGKEGIMEGGRKSGREEETELEYNADDLLPIRKCILTGLQSFKRQLYR